jgi:tRNA 2-selenouridine synthase
MQGLNVPAVSVDEAVTGNFLLVDVRSPREYAEGHAPGAVNVPLLDDRQRASIGATYHHRGGQEARLRALDLVAPHLPVYLRSVALLARGDRAPAIMCWRGGERSRNVVLLLALIGVRAVQVRGGYKAYRRWVLDGLASWVPDRPTFTVYGYTGSGKTAMLRALAGLSPDLPCPRPAVIDLEGMALHRGSMLGGLNQPGRRRQKDFDALLWDAVRSVDGDYLVFEGEGAKVGDLFLPEAVARAVREATPVLLEDDPDRRTARLVREYAPGSWGAHERARFEQALTRMGERLAPEVVASLRRAFRDGRFHEVVRGLLVAYYDPLYQRSSVEGKPFALALRAGLDPEEDARVFADAVRPLAERHAAPTL